MKTNHTEMNVRPRSELLLEAAAAIRAGAPIPAELVAQLLEDVALWPSAIHIPYIQAAVDIRMIAQEVLRGGR